MIEIKRNRAKYTITSSCFYFCLCSCIMIFNYINIVFKQVINHFSGCNKHNRYVRNVSNQLSASLLFHWKFLQLLMTLIGYSYAFKCFRKHRVSVSSQYFYLIKNHKINYAKSHQHALAKETDG